MSVSMLGTFLKPMHREGLKFVAIGIVVTTLLFLLWHPLGWAATGLTIWVYYFFRDPVRVTPERDGLIISPADGVVSMIEPAIPPSELGMPTVRMTRISVFMNVFNCHVNRAPVGGRVVAVGYRPGKFFNASLDKASSDNERNAVCIEMADGRQLAVVQIAGLVARRIVCFTKKGAQLQAGERFGLIRFGSRLDVYLPDGAVPLVAIGQVAVAGETILADLLSSEPQRSGRAG